MGISYNSQERVFRLETAHTTYLIGIAGEEGFLGHVYYGPQLPDDNMQYLMRLDEPLFRSPVRVPQRGRRRLPGALPCGGNPGGRAQL